MYEDIYKADLEKFIASNKITKKTFAANRVKFSLAVITKNPVLWCHHFLSEPDNPKKRFTFFDYQIPSILHRGNTIHKCGAEMGKTREIWSYSLWRMFTNPYGSGLIAAPLNIFISEIFDEIIKQLSFNPLFYKTFTSTKFPYKKIETSIGFKTDFRPTGWNGTQLRGVHAITFAIMEEAAKVPHNICWDEFNRGIKPTAEIKIYSVPDGRRTTTFYRLTTEADTEANTDRLLNKREIVENKIDYNFTLFKWNKMQMPAPYWSPERKLHFIKVYHSELSNGYRQNVMGEDGDPENAIFPFDAWSRLLTDIPEYRFVKVSVDKKRNIASIVIKRYRKDEEIILQNYEVSESSLNISQTLMKYLSHIGGLKVVGSDLGSLQDPSEYLVFSITDKKRLVARIKLENVSYDIQENVIDTLDTIYSKQGECWFGLDLGNAGVSVYQQLQNQRHDKNWGSKVCGYSFGAKLEVKHDDGTYVIDNMTGKYLTKNVKELATDELQKDMQNLTMEFPYDEDIIYEFSNHTGKQTLRGMTYNENKSDHIVDAARIAVLRYKYAPSNSSMERVN